MVDGKPAPLTSEQQMNKYRLRDKMSLLNAEFLQVLTGYFTEKSHYDFTGTMQSYMEHVQSLKNMYKIGDEPAEKPAEIAKKPAKPVVKEAPVIANRKTLKAVRKNGPLAVDSPKAPLNSTVLAASSPSIQPSLPKFGDISVIAKDTPAPASKKVPVLPEEPPAPAPPAAARKRAIRGGGVCGGAESFVFKGGKGEEKTTNISNKTAPEVTVKFPTPSADFWAKPPAQNTGSLFAFLGNDNDNKATEPTKFTGFSFGKKTEESSAAPETTTKPSLFGSSTSSGAAGAPGAKEDSPTKAPLSFGAQKTTEDAPKAPAFSFGGPKTTDESSKPAFSFGAPKPTEDAPKAPALSFGAPKTGDAPKPLAFGSSLFGSSAPSSSAAPSLSFGGGGSLFSGLAQKAMENKDKPAEEEEEYVPPKVETVENEEPNSILSSKVSVFKYNEKKEFTKLGVGMLHIKNTDGKHSVLIRAATAIGTVWLNASCNATMKATKTDEKGERIRLTCPLSDKEMGTFIIRFGSADGAKKFTEKVEELVK